MRALAFKVHSNEIPVSRIATRQLKLESYERYYIKLHYKCTVSVINK